MADGEVHVWHANLAPLCPVGPWAWAVVSDDERRRADRFRSPQHGERYLAAHAWLRLLLARYAGERPEALRFGTGPLGKPSLDSASGALSVEFSLSHSGAVVLCAVASGRRVGVDIERIEPVSAGDERLSPLWLTPWELAELAASDDDADRTRRFYSAWTRREAYLKARGTGVSGVPELALAAPDPSWEVRELRVDADHAAALAVEGGAGGLRVGDRDGSVLATA